MSILHLDLDDFLASLEQLRNPSLRNRPVLVGAGIVASCSAEARRFGCRAGMPLPQALRLCPQAVVREPDPHAASCFAEAAWTIARRRLPALESWTGEAEGELDAAEPGHPLRIGRELRLEILERTGLRVAVGLASNRLVARLAAKSARPDGVAWVAPGAEEDFVADRPVGDLPGVSPATGALLREMNLLKVGDLRPLSPEVLEALLGPEGPHLHESCRGREPHHAPPRELPGSLHRGTDLREPTADPVRARAVVQDLAGRALAGLRRLGAEARRLQLRVRLADGSGDEAARGLEGALESELPAAARELVDRLLLRRAPFARVELGLLQFRPARPRERFARFHAALDAIREGVAGSALLAGGSIGLLGAPPWARRGLAIGAPGSTR